ncbi:MAG: NUDIX domain-containing protein [Bacteroidota bacterium]
MEASPINRFNLRVYGVLIDSGRLLLSDEIRLHTAMTKLPGGGIEYGEGVEEALKREWKEELDTLIEVGELLYVNPFFQRSGFRPSDQVICFYYQVNLLEPLQIQVSQQPFDFPTDQNDQQSFRWISLGDLWPETFTFPIDQAFATHFLDPEE